MDGIRENENEESGEDAKQWMETESPSTRPPRAPERKRQRKENQKSVEIKRKDRRTNDRQRKRERRTEREDLRKGKSEREKWADFQLNLSFHPWQTDILGVDVDFDVDVDPRFGLKP